MKLKFIILSVLATSAVMSCTKSGPTSTKETEIIVQADIVQTRAGYSIGKNHYLAMFNQLLTSS